MIIAVSLDTHFSQKLIKKIQSYGLISLEYDKTTASLINAKNRLKLNFFNNCQKKFITLQLEDILNPKKTETLDSKITNF